MTTSSLNSALMNMMQPHMLVRPVGTVSYEAVKCSPVVLEQHDPRHDRLPDSYAKSDQHNVQSQYRQPPSTRTIPVDLAGKVNGMYRLLDVVGESGSNGHGM